MKRILCFLAATAIIGVSINNNANAADTAFVQADGAGELVTLTITDTSGPIAGAPDFTFAPSTNVVLLGVSSPTSFAIWAHHQNVVAKTSGQQYGMTSDVNKMYFRDISAVGAEAYTSATATNSLAFATAADNWIKM